MPAMRLSSRLSAVTAVEPRCVGEPDKYADEDGRKASFGHSQIAAPRCSSNRDGTAADSVPLLYGLPHSHRRPTEAADP